MFAVPGENSGLGSAINDAEREVGAALGTGILVALANTGYRSRIGGAVSSLLPDTAAKRLCAVLAIAGGRRTRRGSSSEGRRAARSWTASA
jgi:hypothetical protein